MRRISAWKAKSLSLAGLLTLCSSILNATPTCDMQTTFLPSPVCNQIDSLCRHFLWGVVDQRKVHLCRWDQVCHPKLSGGLGLRSASNYNLAFLAKIGWGLGNNSDELWARVLRSKYNCGSDLIPKIRLQTGCSNLWKGVCRAWNVVERNILWSTRDGT